MTQKTGDTARKARSKEAVNVQTLAEHPRTKRLKVVDLTMRRGSAVSSRLAKASSSSAKKTREEVSSVERKTRRSVKASDKSPDKPAAASKIKAPSLRKKKALLAQAGLKKTTRVPKESKRAVSDLPITGGLETKEKKKLSLEKRTEAPKEVVQVKHWWEGKSFLSKGARRGRNYRVDLRVHTPGTEIFFSAGGVDPGAALVRLGRVKGLQLMGVTDHNNASYIDIIKSEASGTKLRIIPGLELCCRVGSCDKVSIAALFPEESSGEDVFAVLRNLQVPDSAFGKVAYCLEMDFARVVETVEQAGGILLPSRLDKTPFSQLAIPDLVEKYGFHAFDLAYPENKQIFEKRWPLGEFTFFSFSNCHSLAQVGSRIEKIKLEEPGFLGLKNLIARRT